MLENVLLLTNRTPLAAPDPAGPLTARFTPDDATLHFVYGGLNAAHADEVQADAGPALPYRLAHYDFAQPKAEHNKFWTYDRLSAAASDAAIAQALDAVFAATQTKPVLLYVPGFSSTPNKCVSRCLALEMLYGVKVIGFSWPAEGMLPDGKLPLGLRSLPPQDLEPLLASHAAPLAPGWVERKRRLAMQALPNAAHAGTAFARVLRLVSEASVRAGGRAFSVACHSMGNRVLQQSTAHPAALTALATATNVALLAPCVLTAEHASWLPQVRPKGRAFVTYNAADGVLAAAWLAIKLSGGGPARWLGVEPGPYRLQQANVRYVCFSHLVLDGVGHSYFVSDALAPQTRELFRRILQSLRDLQQDEPATTTYLNGCNASGSTCYVGTEELR